MTEPSNRFDLWRVPTLFLWWVFLLIGLLPEETFQAARDVARVVTQRAMVNSPYVITLAFAIYLGFFSYRRCQELKLPAAVCQGRALQLAILGLIAFLPVPLSQLLTVHDIPLASLRVAVYLVWAGKLTAVLYLAILFFRVFGLGKSSAYRDIFDIFPSAHVSQQTSESKEKDTPVSVLASAPGPCKDRLDKR